MRYALVLGSVVFLFLSFSSLVFAHTFTNSEHSVDNGEIRWGTYHGTTKYTSARDNAISKWDAEGVINIAGDTAFTIEDLSFTDYNADDGNLGMWLQYSGADKILFNDFIFTDLDPCEQNKTALHEMGHALNLEHNTLSGSVMQSGILCISSLSAHDISDLNSRW